MGCWLFGGCVRRPEGGYGRGCVGASEGGCLSGCSSWLHGGSWRRLRRELYRRLRLGSCRRLRRGSCAWLRRGILKAATSELEKQAVWGGYDGAACQTFWRRDPQAREEAAVRLQVAASPLILWGPCGRVGRSRRSRGRVSGEVLRGGGVLYSQCRCAGMSGARNSRQPRVGSLGWMSHRHRIGMRRCCCPRRRRLFLGRQKRRRRR